MSCDGCQRFRRYYMLGFRDFVMARDFEDLWASDAASCFLGLVEEKLQKQPDCILPIIDDLLPAIRFVGRIKHCLMPRRVSTKIFMRDSPEFKNSSRRLHFEDNG